MDITSILLLGGSALLLLGIFEPKAINPQDMEEAPEELLIIGNKESVKKDREARSMMHGTQTSLHHTYAEVFNNAEVKQKRFKLLGVRRGHRGVTVYMYQTLDSNTMFTSSTPLEQFQAE